MAETFVAQRSGPGGFRQRVCLKRILPERSVDPQFVELFLDEARLLAQMRNGRIVQVYDFGECQGTYYMALELIEGVDLEKLLARSTGGALMSEELAVYVVSELLSALAYAHTLTIDGEPMQLVHRDISPSNVLLSREGEVKLTDFGIAKARRRAHLTQAGQTKGKLAYMSPEQMRAEALDCRSDLFAVGIVLHELVSGVHPFDAATDVTLIANLLYGQRPSFQALAPRASGRLVAAIDALLEPDPANRPLSALEALQLLPSYGRSLDRKNELAAWVARCSSTAADALDGALPTASPSNRTSNLPSTSPPHATASASRIEHLVEAQTQPAQPMLACKPQDCDQPRLTPLPAIGASAQRKPWKLVVVTGVAIAVTVAALHLSADLSNPEPERTGPSGLQSGLSGQPGSEGLRSSLLPSASAPEGAAAPDSVGTPRDADPRVLPATSARPDGGLRSGHVLSPTRRVRAAVRDLPVKEKPGSSEDMREASEPAPRAGRRTKTSFSADEF